MLDKILNVEIMAVGKYILINGIYIFIIEIYIHGTLTFNLERKPIITLTKQQQWKSTRGACVVFHKRSKVLTMKTRC